MEQHNPSNVQVLVAPESLITILGVVYVYAADRMVARR